jgi:hypothetical protein
MTTKIDFHDLRNSLSAYKSRLIKQNAVFVWAVFVKNWKKNNFHDYKSLSVLELE